MIDMALSGWQVWLSSEGDAASPAAELQRGVGATAAVAASNITA